MDVIIIGAGLAGAVVANEFARSGKKVVLFEKKQHVAGELFDKEVEGIRVNMYGPHTFFTDNEEVHNYMKKFWKLTNYQFKAECSVKGQIIPLPFDFYGLHSFFPEEAEEIKAYLLSKYKEGTYVTLREIMNSNNDQVKKVGEFLYENIYKKHSIKLYGKEMKELDDSIWNRTKVFIGQGAKYHQGHFQGLPEEGYTKAIRKMITHKNIELHLGVNFKNVMQLGETGRWFYKETEVTCPIIYTGSIDEVFGYKHGLLPYGSLKFEYELLNVNKYQGRGVIFYPENPELVDITEYKILTGQQVLNKTVISKQYASAYDPNSKDFGNPCLPIEDRESYEKYKLYLSDVKKLKDFHLLGSKANYKFLNMGRTVEDALKLCETLLPKSI